MRHPMAARDQNKRSSSHHPHAGAPEVEAMAEEPQVIQCSSGSRGIHGGRRRIPTTTRMYSSRVLPAAGPTISTVSTMTTGLAHDLERLGVIVREVLCRVESAVDDGVRIAIRAGLEMPAWRSNAQS